MALFSSVHIVFLRRKNPRFYNFVPMIDEKTIKKNIYLRRRTLSISQTEMAERLGLDRNTYRNIESGKTRIINGHLDKIADLLETSPEELVLGYRVGDPESDPKFQDTRAWYDSKISVLVKSFEQRQAEDLKKIRSLEKRIAELEDSLRDKSDLITFLKEKNRTLSEKTAKNE